MPNRHGQDEDYRYGFNRAEKDNEIKGSSNSYNFGARMLDVRTGRWLSLDAYSKPWKSDYQFATNNPIIIVDPDGNDDYYCNAAGKVLHVVPTDFAPRFYQMVETVINIDDESYISVILPKQFQPTARDIERANKYNNPLLFEIMTDFAQAGDKETYMEINRLRSVRTLNDAQEDHKVLMYGLTAMIVAPVMLEVAAEGVIEFAPLIIEETVSEVIEQVTGIPVIMSPTDVLEQGFKKVLRAEVKDEMTKKFGKEAVEGYGSYTIKYADGTKYHGKGNLEEAISGANRKSNGTDDVVTEFDWTPSKSNADSFRDEAKRLNADGGHKSSTNRNQRDSPGNRKYKEDD